MNKRFLLMLISLIIGITGNSAIAIPITDNSLINIVQFDFVNPTFSSTSTSSSFSNTFDSTADMQAFGNLNTGKVGTRVVGSEGSFSQSIVSMFDTLTFNTGSATPVEVSFDLNYEGTLASSGRLVNPRSDSTVRIFDITGLDTWLETSGLFNTVGAINDAELLTFERLSYNLDGLAHNGTVFDFNSTVSGSFMADSSRSYGIQISSNSFAQRNSLADFLGTSTFQFSALNGATFNSGSGAFLSQQITPAPVPEPSTMILLGSGLIGLIGFNYNRKNKTA